MNAILTRLVAIYNLYPARTLSLLAAGIVFAATKAGLVIDKQSLLHALEVIVPIVIAGEATHRKVKPVAKKKTR